MEKWWKEYERYQGSYMEDKHGTVLVRHDEWLTYFQGGVRKFYMKSNLELYRNSAG